MKLRTVAILWVIAIILGLAAYFVKFHGNQEELSKTLLSPGDNILSDLPIRDLTKVTLHQGKDSTTLIRGDDNLWTIVERDNYPVNHELLRNLLGSLGAIKVTQGFPCSSKHYGRFGLSSDSKDETDLGLRVTMINADSKTIAEVYLGKFSGTSSQSAAGRFIRIAGDDSGVYAVGETFPGVYADAPIWLDKQFITIGNIESVSLSAPSDPKFAPWKLKRDSIEAKTQFKLIGITEHEIMKLTSTSTFHNLFSYTSFQDVFNEAEAEKTANPDVSLRRQAIIKTFDGISYIVTFWPQKEKKLPAPDPESPLPPAQGAYLMTVSVSANLAETRPQVADETPEEASQNDAAFKARQELLKEHLTVTKSLEGRVYQIGHTMLEPLQKTRSAFVSVIKP